ncbi:MAG: 16S rRNA (cytosine(1402)-N(4))-methyltransferase, partial [Planctomycetota bacterium]|nr:16S rRNA (cytosine(1402)-N(4))-methyltransferase [Planctomycetota bacterium]
HPATRTFQALRIAVNRELDNLKAFMDRLPECLGPRGRVCIISYHSLEDRIVKHALKRLAQTRIVEIVTRKPIRPTAEEVGLNPRARSAKLRVAQKAETPPEPRP